MTLYCANAYGNRDLEMWSVADLNLKG